MESLLTVSFNNIASKECSKIKKGLRQIESLLSQLCLHQASSRSPSKMKSSVSSNEQQASHRQLSELNSDAAFQEFFRLQDSFQWNIASRLISTLERLLGMSSTSQTDLTIFNTLDVLQGILLLHPPSRLLFSREIYMNLLLDLLDSANPPKIQSQAVLVLVTALLNTPQNSRTFEDIDGLLCVTSVFKSRNTTKDVKMRTLEFIYFYLMPEKPVQPSSAPTTAVRKVEIERHSRTYSNDSGGMDIEQYDDTRTMEDKQMLLSRHLNNVDELVSDLKETSPFGACFA